MRVSVFFAAIAMASSVLGDSTDATRVARLIDEIDDTDAARIRLQQLREAVNGINFVRPRPNDASSPLPASLPFEGLHPGIPLGGAIDRRFSSGSEIFPVPGSGTTPKSERTPSQEPDRETIRREEIRRTENRVFLERKWTELDERKRQQKTSPNDDDESPIRHSGSFFSQNGISTDISSLPYDSQPSRSVVISFEDQKNNQAVSITVYVDSDQSVEDVVRNMAMEYRLPSTVMVSDTAKPREGMQMISLRGDSQGPAPARTDSGAKSLLMARLPENGSFLSEELKPETKESRVKSSRDSEAYAAPGGTTDSGAVAEGGLESGEGREVAGITSGKVKRPPFVVGNVSVSRLMPEIKRTRETGLAGFLGKGASGATSLWRTPRWFVEKLSDTGLSSLGLISAAETSGFDWEIVVAILTMLAMTLYTFIAYVRLKYRKKPTLFIATKKKD